MSEWEGRCVKCGERITIEGGMGADFYYAATRDYLGSPWPRCDHAASENFSLRKWLRSWFAHIEDGK